MAYVKVYRNRLQHNYEFLSKLFREGGIEWGVVTKLLCGNRDMLREIIRLGVREIHDSRISNLRAVKALDPDVQTVYIKPPARRVIRSLIENADVSFNTEYSTIKMLSDEARRQDKLHKIIIMIEMGDLREGVLGEKLVDFYARVFDLPNIEIIGLGANLNCLNGVMPNVDKLIQLSLYKQIIELKFNRSIPWVSGGTSVTIPLLLRKQVPAGINHFRVGETLYFGNNLFSEGPVRGMHQNVFELYAEIIELTEKPIVPIGELAANPQGEITSIDPADYGKTSHRAILDIGELDVNSKYLMPTDTTVNIIGSSSDMLIVDLSKNPQKLKVGGEIRFRMTYMGALSIMNSRYIPKIVV